MVQLHVNPIYDALRGALSVGPPASYFFRNYTWAGINHLMFGQWWREYTSKIGK